MKKTIILFFVLISLIAGGPPALALPGATAPDGENPEDSITIPGLPYPQLSPDFTQDEPAPIVIPDLPRPRLIRSHAPPPEVFHSRITIPVRLSMHDLQAFANTNLARQLNGNVQYLDGAVSGRLEYRLRREEDAKVAEEDGKIKISFPVRFHVRFASTVQAVLVRVPISAQTEGDLDVSIILNPRVERDWSIRTDAEVDFTWTNPPRFNVFMGIQVGVLTESEKFLRDAIRDNLYKIDNVINGEIRLRDTMQREWDNLVLPVRAADSVFLHFDPQDIAAPPIDITPEEVTLRTRVETPISLSIGLGDIVPARRRSLPPLSQYISDGEAINLNVNTLLNYDFLEQKAMRAFSGREVDMEAATVTVRSLSLMGSGENLVAAFEISAAGSSGTIYALGKPHFDEDARVLSMKNLELDVETRDGLTKTAAWLLRPALIRFLSEKLEWELGAKIDELMEEARDMFASRNLRDEFELKGTLDIARFSGLRVTSQGIEIALNLEGAAELIHTPTR